MEAAVALNGQQFETGKAEYMYQYSLDLLSLSTSGGLADPPPPSAPAPNDCDPRAAAAAGQRRCGERRLPRPPPSWRVPAGPTGGGTVAVSSHLPAQFGSGLSCRFPAAAGATNTVPATLTPGDDRAATFRRSPAATSRRR